MAECVTMRTVHVFLLPLLILAGHSAADELPSTVATAFARAGITADHVGVMVWTQDRPRPDLSVNAEQPFQPASTMKLLTSYAALGLLGPAWTWRTEIWHDGTLHDGVLDGNLYVRGNGDPSLTDERLWMLVQRLHAMGLQRIQGDLIIDQSRFDVDSAAQPFDGHPWRAYNAQPAATMLDYNSNWVSIQSLPDGMTLSMQPLPVSTHLVNQLTVDQQPCTTDWRDAIHAQWMADAHNWVFSGHWSAQCELSEFGVSNQHPSALLASEFFSLWSQMGGQSSGHSRSGIVPEHAQMLLSFPSLPLSEALYNMNKYSNNVMARNVFLSLSTTQPASAPAAQITVETWLTKQGLTLPTLVMDNGSGLSRNARISALDMANLLRSAANSAVWPELATSLPIVGVDGTMRHRNQHSALVGHAHIKSGTLDNVKAIAGYVTLPDGRTTVVVCFINDVHAKAGGAGQDALLDWAYQHATPSHIAAEEPHDSGTP